MGGDMALDTKQDVEQLADRLTENANESHDRLLKAIKSKEIEPDQARAAFQQEILLRQQANSLYIDAARCIVQGFTQSQQDFIGTIDEANQRIAKIKKIAAFLDLLADILSLATAAYAAKPEPILASFKEVKQDLKNLRPKSAAKPKPA
jgi:hypothetical protein